MSRMRFLLGSASMGLLLLSTCGGGEGADEFEGDQLVECHDGADNDRDGLFDCDDEGCAAMPWCGGGDGDADGDADWPEPCERVGHPDFMGVGHGVLGPEGGSIELTDTEGGAAGVRVEVAPGAWDECWEVIVDYTSYGTPDYPPAFLPFDASYIPGSISIRVGRTNEDWDFELAPAPLPVTIVFPMSRIQAAPDYIRSALHYDEEQGEWRFLFSQSRDSGWMTVEAEVQDDLWSWGLVSLVEADPEDLEAASVAILGEAAVNDLRSDLWALLEAAEQIIVDHNWDLSCETLDAVSRVFYTAKSATYTILDETQESFGCGPCNMLIPSAMGEWVETTAGDLGIEIYSAAVGAAVTVLTGGPAGTVAGEAASAAISEGLDRLIDWDEVFGHRCQTECYEDHVDEDNRIIYELIFYWVLDRFIGLFEEVRIGYPFLCEPRVVDEGDDVWECEDEVDNDADGLVDCADEGCAEFPDC